MAKREWQRKGKDGLAAMAAGDWIASVRLAVEAPAQADAQAIAADVLAQMDVLPAAEAVAAPRSWCIRRSAPW